MPGSSHVEPAGLAERILGGDTLAETELVRWFAPPTFAILYARTHDSEASRDLLQDVLLSVIDAIRHGKLHDLEKLHAYVGAVARHMAESYLRQRARDRRTEPFDDNLAAVYLADPAEAAERHVRLGHALENLDSIDREIFLRLLDAQKPSAIARDLGLTPDAVRQRKSRALRKLRECLASHTT
jgi:RNA polymerase sigma-70 factor (ECF subfamily)